MEQDLNDNLWCHLKYLKDLNYSNLRVFQDTIRCEKIISKD